MMDEFLDHFLSTQQWQEVGMNRAWAGIALDSFAAMELPKLTTLTFSQPESEPFHHNRSAIDNTGGAQVQNDAMMSHLSFQRMLVDGINQRVRQGGSLLVSNSSLNPMENSIEQEDMPNLLASSSLAFDSSTNFPQTLSSGPLVGPNWHHSFLNTSGVPDPIALGQFKSDSFRASTEVLGKRSCREDDNEEEADQDMMNHIQGQSQNQGQGQSQIQTTPGSNVGPKLRMRARRGQATDPHSIAERNRRERIAERLKALQVLVPDANKTDKASMLDEIIGYVRFLQMQVKCLSVCRLGGSGIAASLIADLPVDGGGNPSEKGCITGTKLNGSSQDAMEYAEWQVARLMDEDMSAAMQYLQNKGLCLMPISLATAISTSTTATTKHQSFPHLSQKSNEGCASQESPLYAIPTPINMPKEDAN